MKKQITFSEIFWLITLIITLGYFSYFKPDAVNIDSIVRTNSANNFNIGSTSFLQIIFGEFIPLLIALFLNNPELFQSILVLVSVIIFSLSWQINPLHLIWFSLTPMGYLLLYNIQPFFISVSICFLGINLIRKRKKNHGLILLVFSILTHWSSLILMLIEYLILSFKNINLRIQKNTLISLILFFSFLIFSFFAGYFQIIVEKFKSYAEFEGNPLHAYLGIVLAIIALLLSYLKIRSRNIATRLGFIGLIIIFFLITGRIKEASRLAFFSDIFAFVFFVDLLQNFLSKIFFSKFKDKFLVKK